MTHPQKIDRYWAEFLGCSTAQLNSTTPIVFKTTHIAGIAAVKKQAWVVSLGDALPQHVGFDLIAIADDPNLSDVEREDRLHRLCHGLHLANPYGPSLLHYLGEDGTVAEVPEIDLPTNILRNVDETALQTFKRELDTTPEYTLTMPDVFPHTIGCYDGDKLVAVGTVRVWEDTLAEVFIDTLSNYRARGLGTYLGAKITEWILNETLWIPQYDSEVTNTPSLNVAERLGFIAYGKFFVTGSGLMITAS